jgi:propionyl-CoA carboxylase alpha chain
VVTVDGVEHAVETQGFLSGVVDAAVDGVTLAAQVDRLQTGFLLTHSGRQHRVRVLTPRAASLATHMIEKVAPDLSRFLICPMPGLLVSLNVAEGDKVEIGQPLAVIEAMKMENILRAEKSGVVKSVNAEAGQSLAVDAIILELE